MALDDDCPVLEPYRSAHKMSSLHRQAVEASKLVGCFYCEEIYCPSEITKWIDGGRTALCPRCGIDSVLPDSYTRLDKEFLHQMHRRWFENYIE